MIENVESLGSELQAAPLINHELLEQRHVEVGQSRQIVNLPTGAIFGDWTDEED
jgi:hypothetical protein